VVVSRRNAIEQRPVYWFKNAFDIDGRRLTKLPALYSGKKGKWREQGKKADS
jgi:hypothetical protein